MGYSYEVIKFEEEFPVNSIIHNIDGFDMYWHKEIEIILALEGTVIVIL